MEGYFIGLKEGAVLRNGAMLAFGVGFAPLATVAWWLHSNNLLWGALTMYMSILMVMLAIQLAKHQQTLLSPS